MSYANKALNITFTFLSLEDTGLSGIYLCVVSHTIGPCTYTVSFSCVATKAGVDSGVLTSEFMWFEGSSQSYIQPSPLMPLSLISDTSRTQATSPKSSGVPLNLLAMDLYSQWQCTVTDSSTWVWSWFHHAFMIISCWSVLWMPWNHCS